MLRLRVIGPGRHGAGFGLGQQPGLQQQACSVRQLEQHGFHQVIRVKIRVQNQVGHITHMRYQCANIVLQFSVQGISI